MESNQNLTFAVKRINNFNAGFIFLMSEPFFANKSVRILTRLKCPLTVHAKTTFRIVTYVTSSSIEKGRTDLFGLSNGHVCNYLFKQVWFWGENTIVF